MLKILTNLCLINQLLTVINYIFMTLRWTEESRVLKLSNPM